MRLDKYLKVSRIIKRRTVANEACSMGRVTVNDKVAKPATDVNPGDIISVRMGAKRLTAEVLAVRETVRPAVVIVTGKGEEEGMLRKNGPEPCERDGSILKRTLASYDA